MDDNIAVEQPTANSKPNKAIIFGFVFGIVATAFYFLCVGMNLSPFAYYPEVGQLRGTEPVKGLGPPMFWYGWIFNGAMAGTISGALACFLPARAVAALSRTLSLLVWTAPTAVVIAILYFLRHFFV